MRDSGNISRRYKREDIMKLHESLFQEKFYKEYHAGEEHYCNEIEKELCWIEAVFFSVAQGMADIIMGVEFKRSWYPRIPR